MNEQLLTKTCEICAAPAQLMVALIVEMVPKNNYRTYEAAGGYRFFCIRHQPKFSCVSMEMTGHAAPATPGS